MKHPESLSHLTLAAIEAALQAGDLLKKGFGTHFTISTKSEKHDLVTEYDRQSEKLIIQFLRDNVPSSSFLAEESGSHGERNAEILWIIDPLDGTVNFAHEIPVFAISIAAQRDGQMLCGVIYQPMTQELFIAEKGLGSYLNGHRIHVTRTESLDGAFLSSGFPYNLATNPLNCIEHFSDVLRLGIPIRRLGAAAVDLAYTAAGRFDGFFEIGLCPWDIAAGILLIEEAGGKVSHWKEKVFDLFEKKPIMATNGLIHKALAKVLNQL
jgi:myo-inositol-1(or 4)-monophosphatase